MRTLAAMTSFVLVRTAVGEAGPVAAAAALLPGVLGAERVAGPYDVVVTVRGPVSDALLLALGAVPGVRHVLGCATTAVSEQELLATAG